MSAKLPISVFIIAKNEADRIPYTLKSVRDWADEVIVIDSGSTDGTVEVAESFGARVHYREWEGYGQQKIYGESLCTHDWLLNLDADEEISPELAREIQALFASGEPQSAAYSLRIMVLYRFQRKLPFLGAGTEQIRLYRKDAGAFRNALVHDAVVLKPGIEPTLLKHSVIHRSFRSYAHTVEKVNFYSSMQAQHRFESGRNPSALQILATPFHAFFKSYFLRRYMFYGLDGFIHSFNYAFARMLRLAKTRELFQEARFRKEEERQP